MSLLDARIAIPAAPLGGGHAPVRLAFTMDQQEQTNWCWAAVARSVARYYGSPAPLPTQCEIVNSELGLASCCAHGGGATAQCNQLWFLDKALVAVGHLNGAPMVGPWTDADVRSEIDASRPIGVRIAWGGPGGAGHFVIVYGYADPTLIDIDDSIYGQSTYDLNAFTTAYQGSGSWTHTYVTL